MSSTKWKVGGSVPGYLSLDVEISLGKILNPRFSLKQMCFNPQLALYHISISSACHGS